MPMLEEDFHPDEVADVDILPAGKYPMQIIESSMASNKNQNGTILTLVLEIIEGQFAKRRVWQRLNYTNPNATAQDISRRLLKQITVAVGWTDRMSDTDVLNFKPFIGTLKIQEDKSGQYDPQNNLSKAEPYQAGGGAAAPGARPAPAARPTPPAGAARPAPAARPAAPAAQPRPPAAQPRPATGNRPWPEAAADGGDVVDEDIPF